jgi:hypothetical protein
MRCTGEAVVKMEDGGESRAGNGTVWVGAWEVWAWAPKACVA